MTVEEHIDAARESALSWARQNIGPGTTWGQLKDITRFAAYGDVEVGPSYEALDEFHRTLQQLEMWCESEGTDALRYHLDEGFRDIENDISVVLGRMQAA